MSNARYYIEIEDTKIPIIVRNYKNGNSIKIFFVGDVLNISKPSWYSVEKLIEENKERILKEYKKLVLENNFNKEIPKAPDKMLYKGKIYSINRIKTDEKMLTLCIDEDNSDINIYVPNLIKNEDTIEYNIKSIIKNLLKNNTYAIVEKKLQYWAKKMNLTYSNFVVNDTKSKYGSCMPKKGKLFFSLRLAMLQDKIIDAIVVHELAHFVYQNHSKDFYNLVKEYVPDYDECDKWLKDNANLIDI